MALPRQQFVQELQQLNTDIAAMFARAQALLTEGDANEVLTVASESDFPAGATLPQAEQLERFHIAYATLEGMVAQMTTVMPGDTNSALAKLLRFRQ